MNLSFTVRALPIAQPRPRAVAFGGHARIIGFDHRHPVTAFKETVRQAAAELYKGPLVETPLAVEILFVFPRPGRLCWKKRPMPRQWHESKPDVENLAKSVLDALTNVLWKDDDQVAQLLLRKVYAAGDEAPSVTVSVQELPPIEADAEPVAVQGGLFGGREPARPCSQCRSYTCYGPECREAIAGLIDGTS